MRYPPYLASTALLGALALGCSDESPACHSLSADDMGNQIVTAAEANNYSFSSTLTVTTADVTPSSELNIDWSGVTSDLVGHEVDPLADIDMVLLLVWRLSEQELAVQLNADELAQSDLEALVTLETNNEITSASLFDFTSFGTPLEEDTLLGYLDIDAFDPETTSYTVMTLTGTEAGEGTRMIKGFRLDEGSDNTDVIVGSESTELEYSVDLTSLEPVAVPAESPDIVVDWADMSESENALGGEFDPTAITEVLVARYSLSPGELEDDFLDLELIADELWRGEVPSGTSIPLNELSDEEGSSFPGVSGGGTWIVALICGSCANPTPWYLSILEACE